VSRRTGLTWAATSVPEVRRQWCNALEDVIEAHSAGLTVNSVSTADSLRLRRLQAKLTTTIEIMKAESEALRDAELYWVARGMVDVALDAALTLPEWTPAVAAPCPNGLLCWTKPAGVVPYGPASTATTTVPWDGVWWWTRPDGRLQLVPASRFVKRPDLLAPFEIATPLWGAHTIVLDPRIPRTEEANGSEDMHPFVSVVGAAWLLMGQPGVTETRTIRDRPPPRLAPTLERPPTYTTPPVTLVELRRPVRLPHDPEAGGAAPHYSRRWWVGGHWRQQACGPNLGDRRPTWIAPYVKGPPNKPLTTDKVYVWRR